MNEWMGGCSCDDTANADMMETPAVNNHTVGLLRLVLKGFQLAWIFLFKKKYWKKTKLGFLHLSVM